MIASNRTRRSALRQLRNANRDAQRARRAVATGTAQPMRTHLLALGLDGKLAKAYAGAVSRNIKVHADRVQVVRKLKRNSRRTGTFPAYTYTSGQARRALAAYLAKGGPAARKDDRAAFYALAA